MNKSIKNRLNISFIILTGSIFISGAISFYHLHLGQFLRQIDDRVEQLQLLTHALFMADQDFYKLSTISPEFFLEGPSPEITRRDSLSKALREQIYAIEETSRVSLGVTVSVGRVDSLLSLYHEQMNTIIPLIHRRGFRDYGLEGRMRQYAHWLEDSSRYSRYELLMLRRHEKDFFLRKDTTYISLLNQSCASLLAGSNRREQDRQQLQSYRDQFNRITELEKQIGLDEQEGEKYQARRLMAEIDHEISLLSTLSHQQVEKLMQQGGNVFIATTVLTLLTALLISYLMYKRLGNPIVSLTRTIEQYINSHFRQYQPVRLRTDVSEIKALQDAFDKLIQQLQQLLEESEQHNEELQAQNEQLRKINQELDMFVYSASHDLRAPLTSLEGLINLSSMEEDREERSHYHQLMLDRIQKLDGYIFDIIDYARNSRLEIRCDEIRLQEQVEEVMKNYRFMPKYEQISKKIVIKQNTLLFLDSKRLDVILRNLISNAIRYADLKKDEPFLQISAQISRKNLSLAVEDNGIGIKPEQMDRIFDMFYRATPDAQGSGLGLFIVKETIEKMGGSISATSEYGQGTLFNITLPNRIHEAKAGTSDALADSNGQAKGILS
jgi:signal transduction histidine kinase